MQNPLREDNPVGSTNPSAPNNRVTKKATKRRSAKSGQVQPVPVAPEDPASTNGVEFDDEEEPSEVKKIPNLTQSEIPKAPIGTIRPNN